MPNKPTDKIIIVWCFNCGKLKVNHFSYPQCPICGAEIEIEKDNNMLAPDGQATLSNQPRQ